MRTAEAAREKERDSFSAVAGKEHRSRMAAALATTVSAVGGLTAEVIADADRLERERGTMLVPQISALVGCQVSGQRRADTHALVRVHARERESVRESMMPGRSGVPLPAVFFFLQFGWV